MGGGYTHTGLRYLFYRGYYYGYLELSVTLSGGRSRTDMNLMYRQYAVHGTLI